MRERWIFEVEVWCNKPRLEEISNYTHPHLTKWKKDWIVHPEEPATTLVELTGEDVENLDDMESITEEVLKRVKSMFSEDCKMYVKGFTREHFSF